MADPELLDFGDGRRLERFGERLIDRPHPAATGPPRAPDRWPDADLRFERETGWTGDTTPWSLGLDDIVLELRPTDAGQVGLFAEHLEMHPWLRARHATTALHLFAYTGAATLALAASGTAVTHVDASRPTVTWARRNVELSGLADRPVRWIVDEAVGFTAREGRRGRRYDLIVLDPPTYGHGEGRDWRLERDLPGLLEACAGVATDDAAVLLTAHSPSVGPEDLRWALIDAGLATPDSTEHGDLALRTPDGRRLLLGAFARSAPGA